MATYKLDIVQRHGKFHSAFYAANEPKPDLLQTPAQESIDDVLKVVNKAIETRKLDEEVDAIIFRNIAYDDFSALTREVKRASY